MKEQKIVRPNKRSSLLFKQMQIVMALFLLLVFALYMVQQGVLYKSQGIQLHLLEETDLTESSVLEQKPVCLILWQDDLQGRTGRDLMEETLSQMRVPYESRTAQPLDKDILEGYETVVLSMANLNVLGETTLDLINWVEDGGRLMFLFLPFNDSFFEMIQHRIGVVSTGSGYRRVDQIHFTQPFMLGGELEDFEISEAYESSLAVLLDETCEVYLEAAGSERIPLMWRRRTGQGTIVAANLSFTGKIYRGFYCAAYSLLEDGFAYPVINGSSFYLDSFPGPVLDGAGGSIAEDYGLSARDFLTQVWWPDIQSFSNKYGVRFTGLALEEYSDNTSPPFSRSEDVSRYRYFGNSLLQTGGEIGLYGYNQMPLVLDNFDYRGDYADYVPWGSTEDMAAGLGELNQFYSELYPDMKFQIYAPPANILSEEGRRMIATDFPQIRVIAGTYLAGKTSYTQEFEVAEDGIVETPRIVSDCNLSEYERLAALSELTFHYVNTHSLRPDEVLSVDTGWEALVGQLDAYMSWLYTAAPKIRNLTGSELAAAVQRYDRLEIRQQCTEEHMIIELGGFVDEAWLLVRLNAGQTMDLVEGGTMEELLDGLYLLKAKSERVEITFQ